MYVSCGKLASEGPHYLALVVGGNSPDKRARAVGCERVNVEGSHVQRFSSLGTHGHQQPESAVGVIRQDGYDAFVIFKA